MDTGVKNVIEITIHTTNCPQQYVENFSRDLNHFTDSAHENFKKHLKKASNLSTLPTHYI